MLAALALAKEILPDSLELAVAAKVNLSPDFVIFKLAVLAVCSMYEAKVPLLSVKVIESPTFKVMF